MFDNVTPFILVFRGLPASGKSTAAKRLLSEFPHWKYANRDTIREELFGVRTGLTYEQEQKVTEVEESIVRNAIADGIPVIVDAMHLRSRYSKKWYNFADRVIFQDFHAPLEELIERDARREHSVGEAVLRSLWSKFIKNGELPKIPQRSKSEPKFEKFDYTDGLESAVICDLDGTLAKIHGTEPRSPYDFTRVSEDIPNPPVLKLVQTLIDSKEYRIIFMSGRDESCREATTTWIEKYLNLSNVELYMRPLGNTEKDSLVKYKLVKEHIEYKVNPVFVLDDRNQVVQMWREIGIPCFQVAEGNF